MKTIIPQQNYGTNEWNVQLKIDELFAEKQIPANDSVRLLDKIVEEMDLSALMRAYNSLGRKPATPPRIMLKILLYAGMEHNYASRKIHTACQQDINYFWFLKGYPMALRENMAYDAEADEYTCQAGQKLRAKYESDRKSVSGYISRVTHYECDNCSGCPYKKNCTKATGNRKMRFPNAFVAEGGIARANHRQEGHPFAYESLNPVGRSVWCGQAGLRLSSIPASRAQEGFDGNTARCHGLQHKQIARQDTAKSHGNAVV